MKRHRILFVNHNCYLDDSNEAMVASHHQTEALAPHGFAVEALTGAVLELGARADPAGWLAACGLHFPMPGGSRTADARGVADEAPPHLAGAINGVGVTVQVGHPTGHHDPGPEERAGLLQLHERIAARGRFEVVVGYGG